MQTYFFLILFSYIHSWSYEYLFSLQKYIIKIKRCLRLLQCSSLLVFFLFFQLFFSCSNDDYVLNTHDFHHARLEVDCTNCRAVTLLPGKKRLWEWLLWLLLKLHFPNKNLPWSSTGHHTDGARWRSVGLNTFCFKLLEKTKRHVWPPTA